jgi:hypothetical protein
LQSNNNIASHARHAVHITHSRMGDAVGGRTTSGGANPLAVVVSVTAAVAGFAPSSVTDDGETVQVAPIGAPVQFHVTVCVKPCAGVAVTV